MPKTFTHLVNSRSSRGGSSIRIAVLHTTEGHNRPGTEDLEGLANYFDGAQASSHRGVDDEGNQVIMVPDGEKAWTQANFNPSALSIEQVGFSAMTRRDWIKGYHRGLDTVAEILADWHLRYNIPLRRSTSHGVCQHKDLGAAGGGHHDCGPGYPMRYVLYLARLKTWRRNGRKGGWRKRKAQFYKRRVLRQQRRYGVKKPSTVE